MVLLASSKLALSPISNVPAGTIKTNVHFYGAACSALGKYAIDLVFSQGPLPKPPN
jgi:hypothetical protein